jgi:cyclase
LNYKLLIMKKTIFQFVLFFTFFIPVSLLSQDWEKIDIKAEQVTENIYMLTGSGGNIGVCIGDDGAFIIDSQYAELTEKILAAVDELTMSNKDIKIVANTHWHGDHTGGNENLSATEAEIVAHENVRKRMSTKQNRGNGRVVDPASIDALPNITFKEDITLHINDEDVLLFHVHNAHTDGDAIVYFSKSNVIHMGDTFFNGRFPFIDLYSDGSINGIIEAANKVLFLADEDTKIIPGHGSLSNKQELTAYRDMLMDVRDRVKRAIKANMTFEEIKVANLTKDLDDEWGTGFINGEKIIDFIYTDLTRVE